MRSLRSDADIFAPMVPLTDSTHGLITTAHSDALPKGSLVILVTRAAVCDMSAVRCRVLVLGRYNVVHTPHNAGRTHQASEDWAEALLTQFSLTLP